MVLSSLAWSVLLLSLRSLRVSTKSSGQARSFVKILGSTLLPVRRSRSFGRLLPQGFHVSRCLRREPALLLTI